MGNIFDHLNMISQRPGMWMGSNKISDLRTYIGGYIGCLEEKNIDEKEIHILHEFHDWVAKYYDYFESTSGWSNMIKDQTETEEEALKLFFELLEKFKIEKGIK